MPIIETEIWKKNPDKPGTIIFDSQRKARDIFVELKEHLKADGRLPDEYFMFDESNWGKGALFPKDAYIYCVTDYGGSEGIYIDIYLKYEKDVYEYNEEKKSGEYKKRMVTEHFATGKTLGDSLEDMDKMHLVAASVTAAFYGNIQEFAKRYARIATGEEQRLYPPRLDNDNMWEQEKPENIIPELKQKLYKYELKKIGFPNAEYIPELNVMKLDPKNEFSPFIDNNNKVFFKNKYRDLAYDKIKPMINGVDEVLKIWDSSRPMAFEDLSKYRILTEYNEIVLAACDKTRNGYGFEFATWEYDSDKRGVNMGHYTDNYNLAKEDFAVRAGLVNAEQVLSSKKYDRAHNDIFTLPERAENTDRIERYFTEIHQIDPAIIKGLIKWGKLFESDENHNAVFVSYDSAKNPKSSQEYNIYEAYATNTPNYLSNL